MSDGEADPVPTLGPAVSGAAVVVVVAAVVVGAVVGVGTGVTGTVVAGAAVVAVVAGGDVTTGWVVGGRVVGGTGRIDEAGAGSLVSVAPVVAATVDVGESGRTTESNVSGCSCAVVGATAGDDATTVVVASVVVASVDAAPIGAAVTTDVAAVCNVVLPSASSRVA